MLTCQGSVFAWHRHTDDTKLERRADEGRSEGSGSRLQRRADVSKRMRMMQRSLYAVLRDGSENLSLR